MSFFNNLSTLFIPQGKTVKGLRKPDQKSTRPGKELRQVPVQPLTPVPATHQAPISAPIPEVQVSQHELVREAQARAREIVVEAKAEALQIQSKAERETREASHQLEEQQLKLDSKLDKIEERLTQMDQREQNLAKDQEFIIKTKADLEKLHQDLTQKLEDISGLTTDEAHQQLLDLIDKKLTKEKALLIRQKEQEAETESEVKVKEILIDAMKHGATEYVAEYTVSVVTIPSEDAKGKIIGKSGRNINAFERATGVDVDLDMSPTEVRLSSFDPVRREIARIALERLIKDGRIQPSRIEDVVEKVKTEIDKTIFEAGKQLCHDLAVYNLPIDLMKLLGKFKYRFSYGQNLIAHTMEETRIGMKLASELGLDANTVKLGCLLHDIGKVSEEAEGSHVELGVKIAKRFNMPQAVIDCIAQHHEDEPFSGPEQTLVYIADAISGARPGARYENYDEYVKRLTQLEEIATQYEQVKQAYAIQAGREVRVILVPERSKDDDVTVLSTKIRDEIKNKMTYPGTVTVTVIREVRGQQVAN
ncbi:MAG: ribonuclease Y [Candidatus Pacebacteria bacterium CG_4_10_14_0_8_um_filter_43_12]|nr:MAG: ribonuclease Y [Candidatus Pacebacteria bacterium CG_4_10_14_0_8_um_filter_43_12]